jgi:hypothetical protein
MYYGLDWVGAVNRRLGGGHVPYVLISASVLWNSTRKRFQKFHGPTRRSLFVDSGGFGFHKRYGEYPFSRETYAELATALGADLVAVRDYPCEPGVNRSAHETNTDRIVEGVTEARTLTRAYPGVPWVPVIQGFTPGEYAESVALHESAGVVRPLMAVGTLCRRKKVDEACAILRRIRRELPDTRLHGFGIDLRFLRDRRIQAFLWSADTAAWKLNNPTTHPKGHLFPTNEEKVANFAAYSERVERVLRRKGPPLESFA